jgi:hypothetical protein
MWGAWNNQTRPLSLSIAASLAYVPAIEISVAQRRGDFTQD